MAEQVGFFFNQVRIKPYFRIIERNSERIRKTSSPYLMFEINNRPTIKCMHIYEFNAFLLNLFGI